jgi:hypothetical protein
MPGICTNATIFWRMYMLLFVILLPLTIAGWVLICSCIGYLSCFCCLRDRCNQCCFESFMKRVDYFASFYMFTIYIPLYMVSLTVYNLLYGILQPQAFWVQDWKFWQKCIVVLFYLIEAGLYALYIAHLVYKSKRKITNEFIRQRLKEMNQEEEVEIR